MRGVFLGWVVIAVCAASAAAEDPPRGARPALAVDDEQPAKPAPNPADEAGPPIPPPGVVPRSAAQPLDEARLAEMIDRAVERALDRRQGVTPSASGALPSPQGYRPLPPSYRIVPVPAARRIGTVPVYREESQYAAVYLPAPWHRRTLAALGARLAECGRPSVRLLKVAPAEVQMCAQPPPAAPPVYPTAQAGGND